MKKTYYFLRKSAFSASLFALLTQTPASATNWTNGSSDGDWFNGNNWAGGSIPDQFADIYKTDDTDILIEGNTATVVDFSNHDADIIVENGGTLQITGATTNSGIVGDSNTGAATLTINNGGRVEMSDTTGIPQFSIGLGAGTQGTVTVNEGGSLFINRGDEQDTTYAGALNIGVGADTVGTLNVNGGAVEARQIWLGGDGGTGIAHVTAGTLKSGGYIHIGNTGQSTGILNISGTGAVTSSTASIGFEARSKGTVNISGGTMSGYSLVLGWHGGAEGTLNASGGKVEYTMLIVGGGYPEEGGERDTKGYINLKENGHIVADDIYLGNYGYGELNIESANSTLTSKSGGAILFQGGYRDINGTAHGVINFKHASGTVNFNHTVGSTTYNKIRINHDTNSITVLSGNSNYVDGTYLNQGTIIGGHEKSLGNGTLYIKGGIFQLDSSINTLSTGGISLESGSMNLGDGRIAQVNLTKGFAMTGGTLTLDIQSSTSFDSFLSSNSLMTLTLTGGTINLTGFAGFEGIIDSTGYEYSLFQNFAALDSDIFDGQGITINGYDKSNWRAKITTDGKLVFEAFAIPEPSSALFVLAGAVPFFYRRRKAGANS